MPFYAIIEGTSNICLYFKVIIMPKFKTDWKYN